jgi:hypothetical protein
VGRTRSVRLMADSSPLLLYGFSYFDPLRKRWLRARCVASIEDIKARYSEYRLEGEPEIRSNAGAGFMLPPAR